MNNRAIEELRDFIFRTTKEAIEKALDETGIPQKLDDFEKRLIELEKDVNQTITDNKQFLNELKRKYKNRGGL